MPVPDHYAVLGVPSDATRTDVSRAFRELARQHHPDSRGRSSVTTDETSDAALKQVLNSYAVLRDPDRRTAYDRQQQRQQAPGGRNPSTHHTHKLAEDVPLRAGPVFWQPAPGQTVADAKFDNGA